MIGACLVVIALVGLVSFYFRLKTFNNLPDVQKEAYNRFIEIKDGASLQELNGLFGKNGKKVFNQNKYRWSFGDSIVVKKNNDIVSFSDFDSDIANRSDYMFKRSPAYIEVEDNNGTFSNAIAVGLN